MIFHNSDHRRLGTEDAPRVKPALLRTVTLIASFTLGLALTAALIGHRHAAPPASATTDADPITQAPVVAPRAVAHPEFLPPASTYTTLDAAPRDMNTGEAPDGTVVHPQWPVPVYTAPGGPAIAHLPVHEITTDTWVPVIAREPGWVQVLLPPRPNGSTGWLSTQDASLVAAQTPVHLEVDTTAFRLSLVRTGGPALATWTVGVGKRSAPTPLGRTFIMASITDSKQTYSPVILPLGIHSTSHETFGGGPGVTALHTWPNEHVFGTRSSDGCIRIPAPALHRLATEVPIGTPVLIH
ncbi:hypothetical protein GCM10022222_51050 [Amycolatopsis ultiminotia]|uniref:L,D-TPase catalytic domain-containing protein n=1 Tax=Amycolatopsis ultiminotia TaxID=543629 RepID=A0ABP6X4Y4_9PSEU